MSTQDTLEEKLWAIRGEINSNEDTSNYISVDEWETTVKYLMEIFNSEVQAALAKAHRANNTHDYDNETDVYIDEMVEELEKS